MSSPRRRSRAGKWSRGGLEPGRSEGGTGAERSGRPAALWPGYGCHGTNMSPGNAHRCTGRYEGFSTG